MLATTVPNGSWPEDIAALRGRTVYVMADNDTAGERKAEIAVEKLTGIATVRRVTLPDLPAKGDVSDWLDAGGDAGALTALARSSPPVAANQNKPDAYPGIISSGDFVRGFVPPDYHIDGIAQSSFLYALTAQTGAGKTAVLLLTAALTALGEPLGNREVRKGRVIYFAGENPDDITMRWIAMAHHMPFDVETIDVHFIKGTFSIPAMFEKIEADVKALGGVDLVIVDTSAAYFQGQDENANVELGRHARELRSLTTLPGHPCVMVACHPTKNAASDNLLPRGGGAFIAEVDGNLVCVKSSDGTVKLHWQGKHRGPDFEPVMFELQTVTAPGLQDSRGRHIPTVMAAVLSGGEVRQKAADARRDEDAVLLSIDRDASLSLAERAEALGWYKDGAPHKGRVRRAADKLRQEKLVTYVRGKWKLTLAGQEAAVEARGEQYHADVAARTAAGILAKHRAKAA
ncbi:AAA family ATPase [Aurantimonas sp. E1-2-R+4]|uniref:AAA family ATPase n=1 Tax=Aurantimonas sp. E1-2-R+4 TaxID=3113714 RepID=UPI002F95590A